MSKSGDTYESKKEELENEEKKILDEIDKESNRLQMMLRTSLYVAGGIALVGGIGYTLYAFNKGEKPKKNKKGKEKKVGLKDKLTEKVMERVLEVGAVALTKYVDSLFSKRS